MSLVFASAAWAAPAEASASAPATEEPRHTAGLIVGLRADTVREDLLVPLTFAGPGFRVSGFFKGWVGPGLLTATAAFGFTVMFNRFGHLGATIDYGLDAAWALPVRRSPDWLVAVGPMLAWDTRVSYLYRWDDARAYWLGAQWLGPAVTVQRALGPRWRLEASASVVLFGLLGRPPAYRTLKNEAVTHVGYYFAAPLQSVSFVTPAQLQSVRLNVALRRSGADVSTPGRGWSFGVDLRVAHASIPDSRVDVSVFAYAARAWGAP